MTTKLGGMGQSGRFGRAALRVAAVTMLVLLVLGATLGTASAETKTEMSGTAYQFVDECLKAGGKVYGAGTDVITCWYAGTTGLRTVCNVVTRICTTYWSFEPGIEAPTTNGTVTGGTATTGGVTGGGTRPIVDTRPAASPGTILVLDSDDQQP